MKSSAIVGALLLLLAPPAPLHAGKASSRSAKPNIVIIPADDLGAGDAQAHYLENKISTPRLDRFIRRSRSFTKPIPNGPPQRGFQYHFGADPPNPPPFTYFENDRVVVPPAAKIETTQEKRIAPAGGEQACGADTFSRYPFQGSAWDATEHANHGILSGGAKVREGRLIFNGKEGSMVIERDLVNSCPRGVFLEMDVRFGTLGSHWIIDNMDDSGERGYLLRTFLTHFYRAGVLRRGMRLVFLLGTGRKSPGLRADVETNRWYHVVAACNAERAALYVDGELADWKMAQGNLVYATSRVYVGSKKGKAQFLDGELDNLRIGHVTRLPLGIASKTLPGGMDGGRLEHRVRGLGGVEPYRWSANGLPDGLSIDPSSGVLSGVVRKDHDGPYRVTIDLTDSGAVPSRVSRSYAMTVLDRLRGDVQFVSGSGRHTRATTAERTSPQFVQYVGAKDRLYAVYQNVDLDPEAVCFDISSGRWTGPHTVAENPLRNDTHGHPAIQADADGFLHVFFGAHGTALKHAVSARPEDISEWILVDDATERATYPNVLSFPDGEMVVFHRIRKEYGLVRSLDNGRTWSEPFVVVDWGEDLMIYPDAGIAWNNQAGTLHLCWSYHEYSTRKHLGVYYAKSRDRGRTWMSADGRPLDLPIDRGSVEPVYLDPDVITYGEDITFDESDNPVILFSTRRKDGAAQHLATRRGGQWETVPVCTCADLGTGNFGGVVACGDQHGSLNIYLTRADRPGSVPVLSKWSVDSSGRIALERTFREFTSRPAASYFPKTLLGHGPSRAVLFNAAFDEDRSFLFCLGAAGPRDGGE